MKNLLFLFLIGLTAAPLFFSCDRSVPDAVVPVDSTALEPEFKISYEVLDSGYVQFNLLSPENGSYAWYTSFGTIRYTASPKIWFRNDLNRIGFGRQDEWGKYTDTSIYVNVTNSIPQIDSRRFMKGVVFGDSIDVEYDIDIQNSFRGGGIPEYDSSTPVAYLWPSYKIEYFSLADLNTVRATSVEKMRDQFKVGPVELGRFKPSTIAPIEPGWQVFLFGKFESGGRSTFSGWENEEESLEILSVEEIHQPPVFPGLEPVAFVVVFRYRATTYGNLVGSSYTDLPHISGKDKIDLTFDVKFNVYPKWVW
ncbi:hypothetical protein LAG90_18335 [Marinilongibacter aquaticus]|uniref:hypothetical protein n=1 Tax=Marinilongibacter aquaticus TaxID=2975157 RepID=UPI0021BD8BBE|nr:hypothetical protein [Marinilongibacter aquaticus]UBM58762.1 hypothetical protein LAG90_18335 [Marinilongibacter aquaticus]